MVSQYFATGRYALHPAPVTSFVLLHRNLVFLNLVAFSMKLSCVFLLDTNCFISSRHLFHDLSSSIYITLLPRPPLSGRIEPPCAREIVGPASLYDYVYSLVQPWHLVCSALTQE